MGRRLDVGNLAFQTTGTDLTELFAQAGLCEPVAIIKESSV